MYKVETRRFNEQVKRNLNRLPKDFMFTLTEREYENLKSQNAAIKTGQKKITAKCFYRERSCYVIKYFKQR